jgi:hypothetical protein
MTPTNTNEREWQKWVFIGHIVVAIMTIASILLWVAACYVEFADNNSFSNGQEHLEGKAYIHPQIPVTMWGFRLTADLFWNSSIFLVSLAFLYYNIFAFERLHLRAASNLK